jgi:hypothetical protein
VSSDPLGYLALAAAGIGYLVYRRRRPLTGEPAPEDAADPPTDTSSEAPSEPATPEPELRQLDTVTIRCEHLDHRDAAPAVVLSKQNPSAALRTLERQGWAGTEHTNLCHYHNPHRQPLETLHVTCDTVGCGERATLAYRELQVSFGRLRWDGWRNRGDLTLCPYCAGTRRHRNW